MASRPSWRSAAATQDVRIVAVSGGDSRASFLALDSAGDLGATRVLPKPFRPDELVEAVQAVLAAPGT